MKYGRKPRAHDPRVPHLTKMLAGRSLGDIPESENWSSGMPSMLGMMLNDSLGDCTCAGIGHADQVWTFNANPPMNSMPDQVIEQLYEICGNYVPGNPSTDNGCVEQEVLSYMLNTGVGGKKLTAYVEIDQTNHDAVKATIANAGLTYIGFNVPSYMPENPGAIWDVQPGTPDIVGGHCVVCVGYDAAGLDLISWGALYRMTWAFWDAFVDEAYYLVDADWIRQTGQTVGGLTLAELEAAMVSLQWLPGTGASRQRRRKHRRWKKQRGLKPPPQG